MSRSSYAPCLLCDSSLGRDGTLGRFPAKSGLGRLARGRHRRQLSTQLCIFRLQVCVVLHLRLTWTRLKPLIRNPITVWLTRLTSQWGS